MNFTEEINKLFEPLPAEDKTSKDAGKEEAPKVSAGNTLNKISQENAHALKRSKKIVSEYAQNQAKLSDLRIRLNKCIDGLENPYTTLDVALQIIEILLNEPVYVESYRNQVTEIRAKHLSDQLAKLYAEENLKQLIDKLEISYSENPTDRTLRSCLSSLKAKLKALE